MDKDDNSNTSPLVLSATTAWCENRLKKKDAEYYAEQRSKFQDTFKEDEFFTIVEALQAVNARIVSLLTSDVKSRKLIGVRRITMEELWKTLNE